LNDPTKAFWDGSSGAQGRATANALKMARSTRLVTSTQGPITPQFLRSNRSWRGGANMLRRARLCGGEVSPARTYLG